MPLSRPPTFRAVRKSDRPPRFRPERTGIGLLHLGRQSPRKSGRVGRLLIAVAVVSREPFGETTASPIPAWAGRRLRLFRLGRALGNVHPDSLATGVCGLRPGVVDSDVTFEFGLHAHSSFSDSTVHCLLIQIIAARTTISAWEITTTSCKTHLKMRDTSKCSRRSARSGWPSTHKKFSMKLPSDSLNNG